MITVCHPCRSDHIGPWTTLRYQKRTKPQEPPSRRDRNVYIQKLVPGPRKTCGKPYTQEPRATVLKPHKCERGITFRTVFCQCGAPSTCWPRIPLPLPFLLLPSLSLEVDPLNPARGLGKRCKLPQRSLGQSPTRNRIWCILALKSDIWWQRCFMIFLRIN